MSAYFANRLRANVDAEAARYARACANVQAAIDRGELPEDYDIESRYSIRTAAAKVAHAEEALAEYLAAHPEDLG